MCKNNFGLKGPNGFLYATDNKTEQLGKCGCTGSDCYFRKLLVLGNLDLKFKGKIWLENVDSFKLRLAWKNHKLFFLKS